MVNKTLQITHFLQMSQSQKKIPVLPLAPPTLNVYTYSRDFVIIFGQALLKTIYLSFIT